MSLADQRLCFRYTDSTIPLLLKSEISSVQPSSVVVQPGLCRTWSETPKTGFFRTRLISLKTITIARLCNLLVFYGSKDDNSSMKNCVIMQTSPCNEYPFTPHFYIVKVGFTGVYIIFLFLL